MFKIEHRYAFKSSYWASSVACDKSGKVFKPMLSSFDMKGRIVFSTKVFFIEFYID